MTEKQHVYLSILSEHIGGVLPVNIGRYLILLVEDNITDEEARLIWKGFLS